jgi:lysophospholipase L1-like esterase
MGLLLVGVAMVACLEIGLAFVRPVERSFVAECGPVGFATPLNHAPGVGRIRQRFRDGPTFGALAGTEYEEIYDEHGIKRSTLRPQDGDGRRVLFMGDSFIAGYDDATTIPQRSYEWIVEHESPKRPLLVLNAGYSSYSPTIFAVQAKRLWPILHPDFVVIDIDETDLFDDAVRYRPFVQRDDEGRIIAVGRNETRVALAEGCAAVAAYPLRLLRLGGAAYYRSRLALLDKRERRNERLFAVAGVPDPEADPELREQMQYFAATLDELFSGLKAHLPARRILVVRHPHLWHLSHDGIGPSWNRAVGGLVAAAAARSGVRFFDAQDELSARFGAHAERYYWAGDMHFNFDGMQAYGELVGRELWRMIEEAEDGGGTEARGREPDAAS